MLTTYEKLEAEALW